ncbi:MAG: amidohydrolase, partial [Chitinophagaceae bacterium]
MITRFLLFSLLLACSLTNAQVFIKNVQVIDVENKKILPGYNVLVMDGKIISVDKRTYKLPEGTSVVDGTGKYLMPGLVDAHVHFFQDGGLHARPDAIDLRKIRPYSEEIRWTHQHMEQLLRMYTSAGITSVIDVGASRNLLKQRDTFATKTYAPIISMTGPLLTTYVPPAFRDLAQDDAAFVLMTTTDSVRMQVHDQQTAGADFVKIWYIVQGTDTEKAARSTLPLVQAAIDQAHKLNMRVAVHATQRISAQLAVEAGADFLVHSVDDEVVSREFIQL